MTKSADIFQSPMYCLARSIILVPLILALTACTGNYLELNGNPYGISDEEMQRDGYAVRAAMIGLANGVVSPDVNTAQFTDCLLGGTMGGYFADANGEWENTISNYNPTDDWTNVFMKSSFVIPVIYSNYRLLHQETDDPVILAVGDIIKVAAMHRVTDTYGPIPYSQIGANGEINVPYDSQEAVYKKMTEELDAAIAILTGNRTGNFSATADVIYGGNVDKWIKFANSLKLRLAMRIVYADRDWAKTMAETAVNHEVGVFTSNEDNAVFREWGTSGNPINVAVEYNMLSTHADDKTPCTTESGDSHAAADIICYMNGYNDPRREFYFTKSEWEGYEYAGMRRCIEIPDHTAYGHRYSGIRIGTDDPICWMNAAEVYFLRAEAAAVFGFDMGTDARTAYETGIRMSFEQYGAGDATAYLQSTATPGIYIDPAGTNSYEMPVSTVSVAWDEAADTEETQERIIIQKWIANWLLGNEAWADFRRTGYPRLLPGTDAGNKNADKSLSVTGARRMEYPDNEAVSNAENYRYAVSALLGGNGDVMSTRLWFDCKPGNPSYNNL